MATSFGGPPTVEEFEEHMARTGQRPHALRSPQSRLHAPYTAVTGFASVEDVAGVACDAYTLSSFGTPHFGGRQLAIGVLVSWTTLNGEAPRQPGRYPPITRLREILDAAAAPYHHRAEWQAETEGTVFDLKQRCLRMVHYDTKEPNLLAQLDRICEIAGPHLDGFQLNLVWPDERELAAWREEHPDKRLVLQLNRQMVESYADNPRILAHRIRDRYAPHVTDVLFDMSMGTGKPADLAQAETMLGHLYDALGDVVGIGLAGGLEWAAPPIKEGADLGTSVIDLQRFFERWPNLSIDAEGRLRDPKTDALDHEKAREYARRAFSVMPIRM